MQMNYNIMIIAIKSCSICSKRLNNWQYYKYGNKECDGIEHIIKSKGRM